MNVSRLPSSSSSNGFVSLPSGPIRKSNESSSRRSRYLSSAQNGGSDESTRFRPLTAAEILHRVKTRSHHQKPWLWERFILPGRLTLLSAYAKVGKSTLAYELTMAVLRGEPYLGYTTRKGRVLILAVEEHPDDIEDRLVEFGLQPSDKIRVWPARVKPWMLADIGRYITDHQIQMVVLDSLSSYWKPESENSNTDIHEWIVELQDLARETGAAVLIICHDRKGGGQYGEQVRGGGDLLAQVDQALLLGRGRNLPVHQRVLETVGRFRETPRKLLLDYTGEPPHYSSLGTPEDRSVETLKVRVISVLRGDGASTTATLMKKTGLKWKTVKKITKQLLADQVISRRGTGHKGDPFVWTLRKKVAA
jgi:hypothetical protein